MRRLVQAGVVITVLSAVALLVVVAVDRYREAANRQQCLRNCGQIAVGWCQYLDQHGRTVPGTLANPALPPEQRLSWAIGLAPYLGGEDLAGRANSKRPWDAPDNQPVTHRPLPLFTCPTAPAAGTTWDTSYVGVAGAGREAATDTSKGADKGAFGYDRTLTANQFTRGRSGTLLLLETRTGGPWAQGGPGTVRGLDLTAPPFFGPGRPFDGDHSPPGIWPRACTLSSAWCDGHARTFNVRMPDLDLYRSLLIYDVCILPEY